MTYVGEDGQRHQPYMVHRALLGSLERFFGILVEHYSGAFPLWLSPEQVRILPISQNHHEYAYELKKSLRAEGFRVEVDSRSETIGAKIKDARNARIPYIAVVGDKEASDKTLSVRSRKDGQLGEISYESLLSRINNDIVNKI
jgi:threonyl-tRNA synthetase